MTVEQAIVDSGLTPLTTIRSIDGRARITYDPHWSQALPFVFFVEGTAVLQFHTLAAGKLAGKRYEHPFPEKDDWK